MAKNQIPPFNKKGKCAVPWCNKKSKTLGYCHNHYVQVHYQGLIFLRTNKMPNEFIERGDVVLIKLYDKNCNSTGIAIIDKEDEALCKKRKWRLAPNGYVVSTRPYPLVQIHNYILRRTPDKHILVDHINRDKKDNRKRNLRLCTPSENNYNAKKPINNTTGIKGVFWHKRIKKWQVSIRSNGKSRHIGYYEKREEAISARIFAENIYHGVFAYNEVRQN